MSMLTRLYPESAMVLRALRGWSMKRRRALVSLILLFVSGCGHATGGSYPTVPESVSSPYSVFGVVRYYRGRPAPGITVWAGERNGARRMTESDPEGQFRFDAISGGVDVWLGGLENDYSAQEMFNIGKQNSPLDFVLYPRVVSSIGKGFIDSSIAGDQLLGNTNMYSGLCEHVACRVIEIGGAGGLAVNGAQVRITLRWNNPASHLGLYIPTDPYYPTPVQRLCCVSELTSMFTLTGGDFDAFLVGFEEFAGHRPATDDVQPFQVSVAF
jgi:hypothetical protein